MPDLRIPEGHYANRADLADFVSGPVAPSPEALDKAVQDATRDMRPQQANAVRHIAERTVDQSIDR